MLQLGRTAALTVILGALMLIPAGTADVPAADAPQWHAYLVEFDTRDITFHSIARDVKAPHEHGLALYDLNGTLLNSVSWSLGVQQGGMLVESEDSGLAQYRLSTFRNGSQTDYGTEFSMRYTVCAECANLTATLVLFFWNGNEAGDWDYAIPSEGLTILDSWSGYRVQTLMNYDFRGGTHVFISNWWGVSHAKDTWAGYSAKHNLLSHVYLRDPRVKVENSLSIFRDGSLVDTCTFWCSYRAVGGDAALGSGEFTFKFDSTGADTNNFMTVLLMDVWFPDDLHERAAGARAIG